MLQGNQRHTGRSSFRGITEPPQVISKRLLPGGPGEVADGFSQGADGTIYTTAFGTLFGLDPDAHTIRMVGEQLFNGSRSTPAIAADGRIYLGTGDTFAVYTTTGALDVIATPLTYNGVFGSSPVIGNDGSVYVVHDALWSFTPDLHLRWVRSIGDQYAHNAPAIGADGTIYTGGSNGHLHAFTPDGELSWSQPTGAFFNAPVIGDDGTIYVGSNGGKVYAFNPDGTQRWVFSSDEAPYEFGPSIAVDPVIGQDGSLYFGTIIPGGDLIAPAAHFYALNADGSLKWKYRLNHTPWTTTGFSEALVDADNTVYVCTSFSTCLAFSADGDLLWSYALAPGIVSGTAPFLSSDGVLWLLDTRGTIHVLADPALNRLTSGTERMQVVVCGPREPLVRTVDLTTSGAAVAWTATKHGAVTWLTIPQPTGQTPDQLQFHIDPTGLAEGSYTSQVRVQSDATGMANRAVVIEVNLTLGCRNHLPVVR
jgi:outer membrane protein assembly factor BamB